MTVMASQRRSGHAAHVRTVALRYGNLLSWATEDAFGDEHRCHDVFSPSTGFDQASSRDT